MTAPELFHLRDEDGHAYVDSEDVPPGLEDDAQLGADSCPERAISTG
jgi:ferredoxin